MSRPRSFEDADRIVVWLELLELELRDEDLVLTVRGSDTETELLYIDLVPGRGYLLKQLGIDVSGEPQDFSLTVLTAVGRAVSFYLSCEDADETANRISDHARAVRARHAETPVKPEVLMSAARSLPTLGRLELGEDSITFEMHHPSYGVAVVTVGLRDRQHPYTLVETGERVKTVGLPRPLTPAVMFGAEDEDGNVYRWYLRTSDPSATAIRVREHLRARGDG